MLNLEPWLIVTTWYFLEDDPTYLLIYPRIFIIENGEQEKY